MSVIDHLPTIVCSGEEQVRFACPLCKQLCAVPNGRKTHISTKKKLSKFRYFLGRVGAIAAPLDSSGNIRHILPLVSLKATLANKKSFAPYQCLQTAIYCKRLFFRDVCIFGLLPIYFLHLPFKGLARNLLLFGKCFSCFYYYHHMFVYSI